jgi:putative ubiquitin-RnfH superfamily antitoxin RatB of RatAB toxin-antitoxin module
MSYMDNAAPPPDLIQVEVAYATPQEQAILSVRLEAAGTVRQAIELSGILTRFPEINLDVNKVGIFSKAHGLDDALREGDRVEIYRPLLADPKAARKQRAAEGKKMKKGSGEAEGQPNPA